MDAETRARVFIMHSGVLGGNGQGYGAFCVHTSTYSMHLSRQHGIFISTLHLMSACGRCIFVQECTSKRSMTPPLPACPELSASFFSSPRLHQQRNG